MSWNYPTISLNVCVIPVYTIDSGVSTQAGNLWIVADNSGNVQNTRCIFVDMNGAAQVPTINAASGNPTAGGSLDFTVTVSGTSVHCANGVAAPGQTGGSYYFSGQISNPGATPTNWHAGHGTSMGVKAA